MKFNWDNSGFKIKCRSLPFMAIHYNEKNKLFHNGGNIGESKKKKGKKNKHPKWIAYATLSLSSIQTHQLILVIVETFPYDI